MWGGLAAGEGGQLGVPLLFSVQEFAKSTLHVNFAFVSRHSYFRLIDRGEGL